MSVDMRETVREAAQQPQHPLDVGEVYRRGRRRRLVRISAIAAAVVAVVGGVLLGGLQLAATRTSPVVGEGPPAEESVRVVQQLGAPGGVRVLVVETPEGICLRFGVEAEHGASCDLDRHPDAVTGAATVLPDADDGNGVLAGRLPDVVTSLRLARDGNTTTAETTDTDAGRFFIATDLSVGEYQLTGQTADGSVYVSGTVDVTRAGTSGVFFIPDSPAELQTIQILDVTGLPEQEAVSQLESIGLDVLVVYQVVSEQAQVGLVIDQDLQPGTATELPAEVTLVVGAAPPE